MTVVFAKHDGSPGVWVAHIILRFAHFEEGIRIKFVHSFLQWSQLYESKKDEKIFSLIRDMKEKGIPIHGVGFQSHLYCNDFMTQEQLNVKMEALKQNILKYQGLDIDVYITEFDLRLNGITGSQKERFDFQGQVYGSVFKTCLENGVKSFSIFGLTDKYSWLENPINGGNDAANSDPLPFDENFDPKPAYFAMFEVLKELYLKSKTG